MILLLMKMIQFVLINILLPRHWRVYDAIFIWNDVTATQLLGRNLSLNLAIVSYLRCQTFMQQFVFVKLDMLLFIA